MQVNVHVHVRARAGFAADAFEFIRDVDVVEPLAGVRMKLLQLGRDDRAGEVVRHQAADDPGLDDVLAHAREARPGRLEVHRQHVAGGDAVFHHLDETDIRGEDGEHLGAVDTGQEERGVGHLAQNRKELGSEHVAVARHHRDQHTVRAAELVAILEERAHVLVLERHQLGEAGVDPQPRREPAHRDGGEQERRNHEAAAGEQELLDASRQWHARDTGTLSRQSRDRRRCVTAQRPDPPFRRNDGRRTWSSPLDHLRARRTASGRAMPHQHCRPRTSDPPRRTPVPRNPAVAVITANELGQLSLRVAYGNSHRAGSRMKGGCAPHHGLSCGPSGRGIGSPKGLPRDTSTWTPRPTSRGYSSSTRR